MKRALPLLPLLLLLLLPAPLAQAAHPCAQAPDGSYHEPDPYHEHPACPQPPGPQPTTGDVSVGQQDDGRTVTLARGQRLFVSLPSSGNVWGDVVAGPALHRAFLEVHGYGTRAVFRALAPTNGQVVSAREDQACLHGDPACPVAPRGWSVTVVVQEGPPPSLASSSCRTSAPLQPQPGVHVLDEQANGTTLRVGRDDLVVVGFTGCRREGVDLQPATGGGPLYRYRVSADNPGGSTAIFRAVVNGTTTLEALPDAPCQHVPETSCPGGTPWRVTVVVGEPCRMGGAPLARPGEPVSLSGRVAPGATVQVWFRPYGGSAFTARRTVTAGEGGFFGTSFAPVTDHRWYATSGDCTTTPGLTTILPTLNGPAFAARGSAVPVEVGGPSGQAVALYARRAGGEYRLIRTGRLDAQGRYRTSYAALADHRYYAVTGPDRRRTRDVLTQVR